MSRRRLPQPPQVARLLRQIREMMALSGVSQAEVAKRLGMSRAAVSQLLHSDADMSFGTLERLARAVHLSVQAYLVPEEENREGCPR